MKKTRLLALLLIAVLGLGIANSQTSLAAETQPINNTQKVKQTKIKLKQGQTKKKTVYTSQNLSFVLDYDKSAELINQKIKYISKNEKVLKFDENGNVIKLKKGKTKVTIKVMGLMGFRYVKYKYKCRLTVKTGVKSIELKSVGNNQFFVGKKYYLKKKIKPATHEETLKWSSSNKKVATVNKKGVVKVRGEGLAVITLCSSKTKNKAQFPIQGKREPGLFFEETSIDEDNKLVVDYGKSVQLHPEFVNITKDKITYKSHDTSILIATQDGVIKMSRPGKAFLEMSTYQGKWKKVVEIDAKCEKGMLSEKQLKDSGIDKCNKLMIVAHPDDDALWGGAHLMEDGWYVLCMTNNYTEYRRKEFYQMLELSNSKGIILDYPDIYRKAEADEDGVYDKDNWTYVYDGAQIDITKALKYKEWDQIVTHSPTGETGHRHHLKINKIASLQSQFLGIYDKLWYFGKFYYKGTPIPSSLPKIDQEHLDFKNKLVNVYQREMKSIKAYWDQMIPYEDWEKATEYGQKKYE